MSFYHFTPTARRICLAWITIALLVAFTGCVQVTPPPEPVTITFECDEEDEAYCNRLIDAFHEDHGHITVELVRPKRYQYPEADVFVIWPFARRFFLQEDIDLLDLTPFIEQDRTFDREDLHPGTLSLFDDDGEMWAVPFMIDVDVMYYNRDLLDRYGVAYPQLDWTWDDFLRIGQALYDPDAGIYGYTPDEQLDDVLAFVYQNGGKIFDDLDDPTRTTFDDPLTVEALDWYAKLMYEREAAATPQQARKAYGIAGYTQTGIEQGRLGMWMGSLSEREGGPGDVEWNVNWGIAPLPRGKQSATFAFILGYTISPQAENPDACWQWVSFLTHQMPRYGMPVRKSLVASEAFEDEMGQDVAAVARAFIEYAMWLNPTAWDIYGTFDIFNEGVAKIVGNNETAGGAMTWAQQKSPFK
jgi:ABC-type glycerol-3-phosphate transport system substrate-binding protein